MKISAIRSDKVYSKIMSAPLDKKNDIYRYELMKPFEKKWACYSVPMKALTPNGYDVIMASEMLGHIAPMHTFMVMKWQHYKTILRSDYPIVPDMRVAIT